MPMHFPDMIKIFSPTEVEIAYCGPLLDETPLATVIYFALSAEESLQKAPFNQPVLFLQEKKEVRVFSFTLPGHTPGQDPRLGMTNWAKGLAKDPNYLHSFILRCIKNLDYLIEKGWIDEKKLAVAGLSRGGFIATHLASLDKRIRFILGYAPLTRLDYLEEFQQLVNPTLLTSLNLEYKTSSLTDKEIRFYIGNNDTRVSTDSCYELIRSLTLKAYEEGNRSPKIELIIFPSIGYKGHGTPPHIFEQGAKWLSNIFSHPLS